MLLQDNKSNKIITLLFGNTIIMCIFVSTNKQTKKRLIMQIKDVKKGEYIKLFRNGKETKKT